MTLLKPFITALGPTDGWKGNCYAIAKKAVDEKLIPGTAVYGMWHGPIAKGSYFEERGQRVPFVQHGWILLPEGDPSGVICDPTRWVFENVRPYIYLGPSDHYDEGANELRRHEPPPEFDALDGSTQTVVFRSEVLGSAAWTFVEKLLHLDQYMPEPAEDSEDEYEIGTVSVEMLFWIANRPPDVLGQHTAEIYRAIDKLGYGAAIPFDNRKMIERQAKASGA